MTKNITTFLLVVFTCFLAINSQTCSTGCSTCTNSTACTTCSAGNFLINSTYCAPCPTGCSACTRGANGLPTCSACTAPAQLDANSRCFLCNPNCLTCTNVPSNCTTCSPGRTRTSGVNGSFICAITNTIQNCLTQATDSENITVCTTCLSGYMPFFGKCVPCNFPCKICTLDAETIYNTAASTWQSTFPTVYNSNYTGLPVFVNGGNFTSMPNKYKPFYIIAYSFASDLLIDGSLVDLDAFYAQVPGWVTFLATFLNTTQTRAQIIGAITLRYNQRFNKAFSPTTFESKMSESVYRINAICTQCHDNFFYVSSGTICNQCAAPCATCNSSVCLTCKVGYFLSNGSCLACHASCLTCSGATSSTCTRCALPDSLSSSNTCVTCNQPCATCSPTNFTVCVTCKKPYSLTAATGVCYRCNQDLCVNCLSTNTSICLQCMQGSALSGGVCQLCPQNCASCSGGNASVCFSCVTGFTLYVDGNNTSCSACGLGCVQCDITNSSICLRCQTGTYLNRITASCVKCNQGCQQCTSPTACTKFSDGMMTLDGLVINCRPGCQICSSPEVCTACFERFWLSSSICRPCPPGCKVCSSDTVCTTCLTNLYLSGGSCSRCLGNCLTCSSSNLTQCTSCVRGSTLVGTSCVNQCGRGCVECSSTNSSICLTCAPGASLKADGTCVRCLGSCSGSCDPRNISICLSCADGFQLLNNQCVRCPIGCATCSNGQCSTCVTGFTLSQIDNGNFVCNLNCPIGCSACTDTVCTACSTGFALASGRCNPDLSCNPICAYCPAGTQKLVNGSCSSCPTNCATCQSGTCRRCSDGYYLSSGTCTACPSQCKTCYDSSSCQLCAPGYVKQILSMDSTGVQNAVLGDSCIACSSNCRTCAVYPDLCISCPDGFRLFSSRCAGLYTVNYQYQLNVAYATFLDNSQSQTFALAISSMTGVNSSDTYISSVRQGSTIISGTMSTSSSSSAAAVQSSLGSSVPGFSVLSSSATIYYGDSVYTQPSTTPSDTPAENTVNKPNVPLIVGLVVGLGGALIIAIAVFLIYKFKCKKADVSDKQQESVAQIKENK